MSFHLLRWAVGLTTGSMAGKAVLMALADFANDNGEAWPSTAAIAAFVDSIEIPMLLMYSRTVHQARVAQGSALALWSGCHRRDGVSSEAIEMTSRVTLSQPDNDNASIAVRRAANDNAAGRSAIDASRCFGLAAANDDWIEDDLPISIGVIAGEVAILDRFLRSQILALFD